MTRTVFANAKNFSHKGSGDQSICSAPDVCKTPVGSATPPIPYPVISMASEAGDYTSSVLIDGNPTAISSSCHQKCSGDEAGTAKGLISGKTSDKTEFVTYSPDVLCEGEGVIRHQDLTTMNAKNTLGMMFGMPSGPETIELKENEETTDFVIALDIHPDRYNSNKDQYELKSECGNYQASLQVNNDAQTVEDHVELSFSEANTNYRYTLTRKSEHIDKDQIIFENCYLLGINNISDCAPTKREADI